ncbi:lytic transglycosylase domain-containing protein [Alkaliphilus serpentinus]|uniref:Lytic transglycosylase domain-containing protein n=2 Tax=Alkaliphilus serpentinus TaxID=1482731 RepID=A0A833HMB2_9FIRM|nr:lytic transglycosylase domain-containing protein [Alkaliphilus serpentinus]
MWVIKQIYPFHYRAEIERYSKEYNLDPYLIAAIIKNESKFNPEAISRKEAKGLMQIAPITGQWAAEKLGIKDYSEDRLFEPHLNIRMGCWYLDILHKEFDGRLPLMIAAYNAGNGNVSKWLEDPQYSKNRVTLDYIPFPETRIYLRKVLRDYNRYHIIYEEGLRGVASYIWREYIKVHI